MKAEDRFIRLTSTGLVIFGRVRSIEEDSDVLYLLKRRGLVPVTNYSQKDPNGTDVNEYERGVIVIPKALWEEGRKEGWSMTRGIQTYIDKVRRGES